MDEVQEAEQGTVGGGSDGIRYPGVKGLANVVDADSRKLHTTIYYQYYYTYCLILFAMVCYCKKDATVGADVHDRVCFLRCVKDPQRWIIASHSHDQLFYTAE